MEDFRREVREKVLSQLTPEERLEGLSAEDRLAGLSVDERLAGLNAEDREKLIETLMQELHRVPSADVKKLLKELKSKPASDTVS